MISWCAALFHGRALLTAFVRPTPYTFIDTLIKTLINTRIVTPVYTPIKSHMKALIRARPLLMILRILALMNAPLSDTTFHLGLTSLHKDTLKITDHMRGESETER